MWNFGAILAGMNSGHLQTGQRGEAAAQQYLRLHGYDLIETNYRSGRWGEIDIICRHQGDLVFVEVKTRAGAAYGFPIEAVTPAKRHKLRRAAEYYKLTHPDTPNSLRFDVVCVELKNEECHFALFRNIDC